MKNKLNVTLNALCVVLFNIVYFASNKYPMHILESGSPLSVLYICLNVICSAFFFYMLTVALTHTEKGLQARYLKTIYPSDHALSF